jgi:hypothetical protein
LVADAAGPAVPALLFDFQSHRPENVVFETTVASLPRHRFRSYFAKRVFMMFPKLLFCSLMVLWSASQLPAQSEGPAPQSAVGQLPADTTGAAGRELIASRLQFLQEMYGLDAEKTARLRTMLSERLPAHRSYQDQMLLTFRRLRVALALVKNDAKLSPAEREKRTATFERQYYEHLAKAPLGMTNVIKLGEAMLSEGQVAQGRARIKAKLGDRLGPHSEGFDLSKIDAILTGPISPIELPDLSKPYSVAEPSPNLATLPPQRQPRTPPANATPRPPRAPITTDSRQTRPNARARKTSSPLTRAAKPRTPPKRTANRPPQPLRPAPPDAEWAKYLEKASTDYAFTKAQEQVARAALSSCQSRAAAHRAGRQAEYQEAENTADPAKKAEALRQLNHRLDQLYAELTQRVDAVASLEQRRKAGKDPAAQAAPPKGQLPKAVPAPKKEPSKPQGPKADAPEKEAPKKEAPKKEVPKKDAPQ